MRCKPPCLAWIRSSLIPDNVNTIVQVTSEFIVEGGIHYWLVVSPQPTKVYDRKTGMLLPVTSKEGYVADNNLTPINDPGLDTKDTGKDRPIEKIQDKPVDKPVVETWEWPNV